MAAQPGGAFPLQREPSPAREQAIEIICGKMGTTKEKVSFEGFGEKYFGLIVTQYSIAFRASFFGELNIDKNVEIHSIKPEQHNSNFITGIFTLNF